MKKVRYDSIKAGTIYKRRNSVYVKDKDGCSVNLKTGHILRTPSNGAMVEPVKIKLPN